MALVMEAVPGTCRPPLAAEHLGHGQTEVARESDPTSCPHLSRSRYCSAGAVARAKSAGDSGGPVSRGAKMGCGMTRRRVVVIATAALWILLVVYSLTPAGAHPRLVRCGSIPYAGGGRVHIEKEGHVTCHAARRLAKRLYEGKGVTTGGPSGASYRTRLDGWICYGDHVACHRKHPWAWVYGM